MAYMSSLMPALMQSQTSSQPQSTMPTAEQQIYNYLYPTGGSAVPSAGSLNPYAASTINQNTASATAANPLQPSYMSTPVQGQATNAANTQIGQGVNQQLNASLSPAASEQALYSAYAPAQATATRSLNDTMAAMGLQGGPALAAQNNLQSQMGSSLGQSLAGLISGSQANQLSLANNQAGLNQATTLANQSANNTMTGQNLSNIYNTNQYNTTAANDANAAYAQALQNAYNQNYATYNTMNQAGYTGATNLAGQAMGGTQSLAGNMYSTGAGASNNYYSSAQDQAYSNLGSIGGAAAGGA